MAVRAPSVYRGDDRLLFGIILGVLAFWLFAQTTLNIAPTTAKAAAIVREAFGADAVMYPGPSYLGSEDFAFMLQEKKGTYCLLGNGDTPMVHHPQYVFNDAILAMGAAYWVTLTEQYLA
jgi:hippurate hydrolase